jgi:hypothetical protein
MSETSQLIEALKKASAEPEARPAFYALLLKTAILVPGLRLEGPNGAAPRQVRFKQWPQPDGSVAIPFFPDPEALKKVLGEDEPHLVIPALELFRLTRGTTLVLTCADGLSKAFKPDEVDMLMSSALAIDPLAAALERAVREESDETKRQFYQVFVNSQVFVFGEPRPKEGVVDPQDPKPLGPEDKFTIATSSHPQKEGERIIPFFSSGDLLQKAARGANLPPQTTFLGFHTLTLLQMAKGMGLPLVLNLGPMTYKIFNLDEIDFLLANSRTNLYEERQLPAGSQVQLAPPEVYPQDLVGAILDFLPAYQDVLAAYLTTLKEEPALTVTEAAPEAAPGLVIGLETEAGADLSEMLHRLAPLVNHHAPKGQAVDFTQIRPGEKGLSQLLKTKVEPFYRRSLPASAGPAGQAEPEAKAPSREEEADATGLFGRLKRIFKG